jgi:ImpA, N-terminal, type VI secretion system
MDVEKLLCPIPDEGPCGRNLEDTQLLLSFDAYNIFAIDESNTWYHWDRDWPAIKTHALEALQQSKDLRLLAYLAAAELRTGELRDYVDALAVAAGWLRSHWDEVYPSLDEDAIARSSALKCLTDGWAIRDGLHRVPLITHEQLGAISFRDLEIADGVVKISEDERFGWDEGRVRTIVQAVAPHTLRDLYTELQRGMESLTAIDESITLGAKRHDTGEYPWSFNRAGDVFRRMMSRVSRWKMEAGIWN